MEQNYSMKRDIVLLFFSLLVIFCAESSNVHVCRHMEPYMDISQIYISGKPKISSEYAYVEKHDKLDSLEQILCNKPQIQESVYMHIDNTGYFLGDTLWYKAYVMRSDNFKPTNISRILYVELLTSDGYLVERQQLALDENSTAYGQFVIRDSLYSGYYELRAYTKWMLNFNVTEKQHNFFYHHHFYNKQCEKDYFRLFNGLYSRVIPIYEKNKNSENYENKWMQQRPKQRIYTDRTKLNVCFFPEGGQLVSGINSRVAFEATNEEGKAVSLEGVLTNGDSIKTEYMGRGSFLYTPTNEKAMAIFNYMGKTYSFNLPKAEAKGAVLNYDNTTNEIKIGTNIPLGAISISCRGVCTFFKRFSETPTGLQLSEMPLRTGVNDIVLYDTLAIPIATRQIFVNNKDIGKKLDVSVSQDIQAYELSKFEINTDTTNSLKTVSVSIKDMSYEESTYNSYNILTDLLLCGDLKGFVASPDYYFKNNEIQHPKELDLLMLVQGWRKYKRIDKGRYAPEKSLTYEGQVLPIDKNISDDSEPYEFVFESANDYIKSENVNYEDTQIQEEPNEFIEKKYDETFGEMDKSSISDKKRYYKNIEEDAKYLHKKNIKSNIAIEAELVIGSEVFGQTYTLQNKGYFRFNLPEFYGKGILFLTAYNKKDSIKKSLAAKNDVTFMCGGYPEFYIKRDVFFPQFSNPFSWYQVNTPDPLDSLYKRDEHFGISLNDTQILPTVVVKKKRRHKRSLKKDKPALVWDAYCLFNEVVDYGLCQGIYNPQSFPLQASIFLFGYMNMTNDPKIHAIVNGSTYMRNFDMNPYLYNRFVTNSYLEKVTKFKHTESFRIYTDFDKRKDINLERDGDADVTFELIPIPDDGSRYIYRDRRYIYQGYNYPMEFYHPDYSQSVPKVPNDYRRTLYWNPNAEISDDGTFTDTFFGNSHSCKIAISVCGVDKDGQLYYYE